MRSGFLFSIIVSIVFCAPVLAVNGDMGVGTEPLTDGSAQYPYLIEDLADFDVFANPDNTSTYWAAGVHTKLMTDIDLSGRTYTTAVIAPDTNNSSGICYWKGISFNGAFDGNGFVVINLTIDTAGANNHFLGLFGMIEGAAAEVKNLGIEGLTITGGSVSDAVGGLCGSNGWWTNPGGTIINCYSAGSVSGDWYVGGLLGRNDYSSIVTNCYSVSSVNGDLKVGGLVGENYQGHVTNCYSMGSVNGNLKVGGLVGDNNYSRVTNCYSTGSVSGTGNDVGGLVGDNDYGHVTNSFWDVETSDLTTSAGGTGKTTLLMQTQATYTDASWDFVGEAANGIEDIWWIDEGNDYPRLWWEFTNTLPVADAGADVTVYAWIDGLAEVQLDGTGSSDEDGDVLEYFWYNDANELIATGAEPNVVLGVGEHVIDLIVNDGIEDSEPNWCVVTVVEAIETDARVLPQTLNLKRHSDKIIGWLTLPRGIGADELDRDESMVLLPGDIEPVWQRVLPGRRWWRRSRASVVAFYDADLLCDELTGNTMQEITLVVKLESGQFVYGTDRIRVIDPKPKKFKKQEKIKVQKH